MPRYYLDMLRFDWYEQKNSAEFGLKTPRAFSAIHMDAYFMIRSMGLTDLFLQDCARKRKRLRMKWVA